MVLLRFACKHKQHHMENLKKVNLNIEFYSDIESQKLLSLFEGGTITIESLFKEIKPATSDLHFVEIASQNFGKIRLQFAERPETINIRLVQ